MVGKQIPPKKTPNQESPPKSVETYTVAPSAIVQGAASAAADAALQAKKRDDVQRPLETVKRRDKGLPGRLVSLDAFRGFIMTMLAASGFGIAKFAEIDDTSEVWTIHNHEFWNKLAFHFDHPAWRSAFDYYKVSFWDLIQPLIHVYGGRCDAAFVRETFTAESFLSRASAACGHPGRGPGTHRCVPSVRRQAAHDLGIPECALPDRTGLFHRLVSAELQAHGSGRGFGCRTCWILGTVFLQSSSGRL
jgi:hypothetical protein